MDIDNDGMLDRVIRSTISMPYDGSALLVQSGDSASELHTSSNVLDPDTSRLLPCQLGPSSPKIQDCPPLSIKGQSSGIEISSYDSKKTAFFDAVRTETKPFRFQNISFVGLYGPADMFGVSAVLKLLPGRRMEPVCLVKKIPENY